jgi:hypothetical protein
MAQIRKGSNSQEWLTLTSPKAVIISAGHNESFGHPRCSVISRYLKGSPLLNSSKEHLLTCYVGYFMDAASPKHTPLSSETDHDYLVNQEPLFKESKALYNTFDQGSMEVELGYETFTIKKLEKDETILEYGPCQ